MNCIYDLTKNIVFFLSASLLNSFTTQVADWLSPPVSEFNKITDTGHIIVSHTLKYFGYNKHYLDFPYITNDFLIFVCLQTAFYLLLHKDRIKIFSKFFRVYAFLNLLRSISVILTVFPDIHQPCISRDVSFKSKNLFPEVFSKTIQLFTNPNGTLTCGDFIFSGHTMLLVICCLSWYTYPSDSHFFKLYRTVCITIPTIITAILIIAVRLHYTIDVFLAIYFSIHIWNEVHRISC
jgi:hypothetical protein